MYVRKFIQEDYVRDTGVFNSTESLEHNCKLQAILHCIIFSVNFN